ncbi:UDP-N-acetylglucosamine 2-epimerase [Ornithinibacillus halotolerans]|uniref:UDP-N-acetylglucosamine 2-epimerase n=1 Tax=Ornithinibacillus halotolerans TaxID=1274357 RepID=UPI001E28FC1D
MEVLGFHNFLSKSNLVLTDSGGIQEEVPSLGKPVLVMVKLKNVLKLLLLEICKLVGIDEENIYKNFKLLLEDRINMRK